MKAWNGIVVHCSASAYGCRRVIWEWHTKERGWTDVGYHIIVLNGYPTSDWSKTGTRIPSLNGSIECGRIFDQDAWCEDNETGAHALGLNDSTLGVCLIGDKFFTETQFRALASILGDLMTLFPAITVPNIVGHCETASGKKEGKTCPNFNMTRFREWFAGEVVVPDGKIAEFVAL